MGLSITKRFTFDFAHRLPEYDGKCANLHGHQGILEVEVVKAGKVSTNYPTMIMDFGDLKKIVNWKVINKLDHTYLNDLIEIPTAESIVRWIKDELFEELGFGLARIRFYETPDSYCEWVNDGAPVETKEAEV